MPVNVRGLIDSRQIKVTIRDGIVKPFFLGSEDLSTMVVLESKRYPKNQEGLHLVVQGGLWLHRRGMPMGQNENDSRYIKTGEDKWIEKSNPRGSKPINLRHFSTNIKKIRKTERFFD